ncbi:MFS transporter [Neisseriaceae bacterium TC5R-5]|nr:MFS transporter [Neisseriaceae bacterium TC5R-5]
MNTETLAARPYLASLSAMIGISLLIMLVALDSTVVGTAMPRIVAELQGYSLYPWIASSYLMTNAVMIPIIGRVGDLYGRKPFVLASIVLFTLASVLCGMAESMLQLILARGLQGVGGGMLTGVAFASVTDLFPDRLQRVRWQAMLSASFGIASAVGPALGGWMTEHFGWRSVFYVNVPVALLAFPIIWRYLPKIVHHDGRDKTIDWLGAVLLAVAMVTLLLATEEGQSVGLSSWIFIVLLSGAVVAGLLFIRHQSRSQAPVIPMILFASSAVRYLSILGVLSGLVMFALVFYTPLLLQGSFGLSPNQAGLMLTPLLISVTIGSILNGRLLQYLQHPERLVAYGLIGLFIGSLCLATVTPHTPRALLMAIFGLCGLSLGFQLPNLTIQIQAAVARQHLGVASALIQTMRMLGSMLGTSIAAMIVNFAYSRHINSGLTAAHISDSGIVQLLATPQVLVRQEDHHALLQLAQQQGVPAEPLLELARSGLMAGVHHVYLACALLAAVCFVISLKLPPYTLHISASPHDKENEQPL